MGSFYVNITANTPAKEAVSFLKSKGSSAYVMPTGEQIKGISAYVIPTGEQQCVIYESIIDTQDVLYLHTLLQELTTKKQCLALGVLNHDDDMLYLTLWDKGEQKAEFTLGDAPEDMDENYELDDEGVPIGWSETTEEEKTIKEKHKQQQAEEMSQALAASFSMLNKKADILQALLADFVFAREVHASLAEILDLPECTVGLGYNYIAHMQPEEKSHYNLDLIQLVEITKAND